LEQLTAQLGGSAVAMAADVTDRDGLVAAGVKADLGGADVLVNSAGVMFLGPFGSTQREEARRMVAQREEARRMVAADAVLLTLIRGRRRHRLPTYGRSDRVRCRPSVIRRFGKAALLKRGLVACLRPRRRSPIYDWPGTFAPCFEKFSATP
jgi:NAD(P)-dependent dehydrogenase (short-subunit alcohol dehydrogenase family)